MLYVSCISVKKNYSKFHSLGEEVQVHGHEFQGSPWYALPPVCHSEWMGGRVCSKDFLELPILSPCCAGLHNIKSTSYPFSPLFSCFCMCFCLCGILLLLSWPSEHFLSETTQALSLCWTHPPTQSLHWTWPCGAALGVLVCLSCCSECPECLLVFVYPCAQNSAFHIRYAQWLLNEWNMCTKLFTFILRFFRLIFFPLTWLSHLHLKTYWTWRAGSLWNCYLDAFAAILPTVGVLVSCLVTKNYLKREVEKYSDQKLISGLESMAQISDEE